MATLSPSSPDSALTFAPGSSTNTLQLANGKAHMIRQARTTWRAIRRTGRQIRRSGALLALPLVLALGLLEPLACILHCALWMPLARGATGADHAHHHGGQHDTMLDGAPCPLLGQPGSADTTVPAAPFHEMALGLALIFVVLALLQRALALPRVPPLRLSRSPPLRPPIFC